HPKPPASCTPNPLLIVEAHGWHVRESDRLKRTDVHSGFHGGGDAEKIYAGGIWNLVIEKYFLKATLSADPIIGVRLPGKFFAVQTKWTIGAPGQELVVVLWHANRRMLHGDSRQRVAANCADTARGMQMCSTAATAEVHEDTARRTGHGR